MADDLIRIVKDGIAAVGQTTLDGLPYWVALGWRRQDGGVPATAPTGLVTQEQLAAALAALPSGGSGSGSVSSGAISDATPVGRALVTAASAAAARSAIGAGTSNVTPAAAPTTAGQVLVVTSLSPLTFAWQAVGTGVTIPVSPVTVQQLTMSGSKFFIDAVQTRLAVGNFYDGVVTDNITGGTAVITPQATVTNVLRTMRDTNHNAVRCHTLLINNDAAGTYLPNTGNSPNPLTYDEQVLQAGDFFLSEARRIGLVVMAPAIDRWFFYHGGASSWANTRLGRAFKDSRGLADFLANTVPAGATVGVQDQWFTHVGKLFDRVNTLSGLTWFEHLQFLQSGNEVYDDDPSAPNDPAKNFKFFHLRFSAFVKARKATRVVGDGSSASGNRPKSWALTDPNTDYVGDHFYNRADTTTLGSDDHRMDIPWMRTDMAAARAAGKAGGVDEYDWRDVIQNSGDTLIKGSTTHAQFLAALMQEAELAAPWCYTGPATVGHNDGYQVYLASPQNAEQARFKAAITEFNARFTASASNPPAATAATANLLASKSVALFTSPATAASYSQGGAAVTLSLSTTHVRSGATSLQVQFGTTGGYTNIFPTVSSASIAGIAAPVTPGQAYTGMLYGWAGAAGQTAQAHITWFTSTQGYIGGASGTAVALTTTGWTQYRVVATAPAGAAYGVIQWENGSASAASALQWIADSGIFAGDVTTYVTPA